MLFFSGISADKLSKLQVIQNRAAKLIVQKKKLAHSTPILYDLHWLPVKERINYKIALFCFKCLNNNAPSYLKDFLNVYLPPRMLRSSSDQSILKCTRLPKYKFYGERSFEHIGPRIWNDLPRKLREAPNVNIFKSRLKHYLFLRSYN